MDNAREAFLRRRRSRRSARDPGAPARVRTYRCRPMMSAVVAMQPKPAQRPAQEWPAGPPRSRSTRWLCRGVVRASIRAACRPFARTAVEGRQHDRQPWRNRDCPGGMHQHFASGTCALMGRWPSEEQAGYRSALSSATPATKCRIRPIAERHGGELSNGLDYRLTWIKGLLQNGCFGPRLRQNAAHKVHSEHLILHCTFPTI